MGGTVKLVTNQPKLGSFEGSVQGTLSDTQGGSGNGGGSLMLNIPIGQTLALRVVGTDTYRSGWLDRVVVSPFPQDVPVGGTVARANVLAGPIIRFRTTSTPKASTVIARRSCSNPTTTFPSRPPRSINAWC